MWQRTNQERKRVNIQLFIIDPQNDFLDIKQSALPVRGADADMTRAAKMIERIGPKLNDISITLDSHQELHIAHPMFWENQKGQQPTPFTLISAADIEAGIWRPRNALAKPAAFGDQTTIASYALSYARALEKTGQYVLLIWPPHCVIGTWGHNVHTGLQASLKDWCRKNFATINIVTKGSCPWTEHFGGLRAAVPLPSDPSTGLRTDILDMLSEADIIGLLGEASSHCVRETVNQIINNFSVEHARKFALITDCMSPVDAVPGGPDFPAIASDWIRSMEKRGVTLTTSEKFLA